MQNKNHKSQTSLATHQKPSTNPIPQQIRPVHPTHPLSQSKQLPPPSLRSHILLPPNHPHPLHANNTNPPLPLPPLIPRLLPPRDKPQHPPPQIPNHALIALRNPPLNRPQQRNNIPRMRRAFPSRQEAIERIRKVEEEKVRFPCETARLRQRSREEANVAFELADFPQGRGVVVGGVEAVEVQEGLGVGGREGGGGDFVEY